MAHINQTLLTKIKKKLNIAQATAYSLIQRTAARFDVPTNVAALIVARDAGIAITRFASDTDWQLIRGSGASTRSSLPTISPEPPREPDSAPRTAVLRPGRKTISQKKSKPTGNKVWVVYGRNEPIRKALFEFLRSIGLHPIEWNSALESTKMGSPHIAEVLDAGFKSAVASVVLFTPDDDAKLKDQFLKRSDESYERKLTGQPRPNVLFEAGMAFGRYPKQTILVQVGKIRPISDLTGRHVAHLSNSFESRHQLIVKLRGVGCPVDDTGDDWHTAGDFS